MDWDITITKAENGYVCEYSEEIEDGRYRNVINVIEENALDGLEATEELMRYVAEYFGVYHSKHEQSLEIIRRNPDGTIEGEDDLQDD